MGLDMYLTKNKEEVGYWRKANAIHSWFSNQTENGLGNCEEMIISKEILEDLLLICSETLSILNKGKLTTKTLSNGFSVNLYDEYTANKVSSILPTASGFFWGSESIDDLYREDIETTIEICKNVLDSTDWEKDIVIYYAWW